MVDLGTVKRQRWSGVWNGVVIGMGLAWLLDGNLVGILPLVVGTVMEWIQRRTKVLSSTIDDSPTFCSNCGSPVSQESA